MHFSLHEYTEYIFYFSTNSLRLFKAKATLVSNLLRLIALRRVVHSNLEEKGSNKIRTPIYTFVRKVFHCSASNLSRLKSHFKIIIILFCLQPHVNDASEQEKYMSYVFNMTENEAKYLLSSSTHRLIDIRCQGLASDQKVKELDHKDYENHKWIKRQQHDLNVLKSAYDMRFMQEERKYRKKIAELTLKTEEQIDEKDKEIQSLLEENTKAQAEKTKYKQWYNLTFRQIEKLEEKEHEIQKLKAELAKYKHRNNQQARDDSMTTPVKSSGGGHRTKAQEKKIHVESSRSSKPLAKSSAKTAVVQPNNHSVTED